MMRIRLISLISAVVMLLTLVVGCAGTGTATPSGGKDNAAQKKAQLTVAMNPIFVYDDGEAVIAYNDIKNAMQTDYEKATLTAMYNAGWQWAYGEADNWTLRATHDLSRWHNGAGITAKKTNAYTFNADSSISVMPYASQNLELATYDGTAVPEYGLLLSVSGSEQEGLCYTVQKDGILNIPTGTITAVEAVAGVNTGFLAEDGTARQAAVSITVNSRTVWSGTLCNATAGDGTAVTALSYPQITDIPVTAGDYVIVGVELDAQANRPEDITTPEDVVPDDSTVSNDGANVDVDLTPDTSVGTGNSDPNPEKEQPIPLVRNYASTFVIVREADADITMLQMASSMRTAMETVLDTDVIVRNDSQTAADYEILLGKIDSRPESVKIYKELLEARVNNADDYIIRRIGTKVYIVATNTTALQNAVDAFMATYCADDDGKIPAGLNKVYREKKQTILIDNANIASYVVRTERNPSQIVTFAAEALRDQVLAKTGYMLQIVSGGKATARDIQLGPQNDGVRVVWNSDETRITDVQDSGYLNVGYGDYAISVKNGVLAVNGGSSYAVDAGVQALIATFDKQSSLSAGYTASGSYQDDYSLSDGYGLTWREEFDYNEGSIAANEKAIKKRWTFSTEVSSGPTPLGTGINGEALWDEQRRPNVYGENYWVDNGLLWQITKKESYGYDAIRMSTTNKMCFVYGILEVRMVPGTRNGACSSLWMNGSGLGQVKMPETDVYENFGKDALIHASIRWADQDNGGNRTHFGAGSDNETWITPKDGDHFYDSFHYIGLKWTPDTLAYYVDGVCTYSHDITGSEYEAQHNAQDVKLANGVGTPGYTAHGKGKDPQDYLKDVSTFYETQLVDYVRIYQQDNEKHVLRER